MNITRREVLKGFAVVLLSQALPAVAQETDRERFNRLIASGDPIVNESFVFDDGLPLLPDGWVKPDYIYDCKFHWKGEAPASMLRLGDPVRIEKCSFSSDNYPRVPSFYFVA